MLRQFAPDYSLGKRPRVQARLTVAARRASVRSRKPTFAPTSDFFLHRQDEYDKKIFSAQCHDFIGMGIHAEPPARNVNVMHAVVAGVAATEIRKPTPG